MARHRAEIAVFAGSVAGAEVRFAACSWREWLAVWPSATRTHADAISCPVPALTDRRYFRQRNAIYTVDPAGTLTAMRPSEPRSEDFMQKLVAAHPELITDQDGALLLIRREHPIADREEGSGRWSLDHLFVTQSGVPVLVELKRAVDTRLRREVIGQMLDYAANATAYWQGGRIAESFAATMTEQGRNATAELASFLGTTADPEQFWERVDANFAAGTIKMVIVADMIPRELARIVEFLNEQMRADVRAVELSWFEGPEVSPPWPRALSVKPSALKPRRWCGAPGADQPRGLD